MIYTNWLNNYTDLRFSTAIAETVGITGLSMILGYWFLPTTPFFATQGFSWLIIGPLLIGLRYGLLFALFSVLLIIEILFLARGSQLPWADGSLPTIGFALIAIAFIAGEFRNYWERKLKRLRASVQYLDERHNEACSAFNIMKVSHERLEESIVSQVSLRDNVLNVRKLIMDSNLHNGSLTDAGSIILRILSEYGDIQSATLYKIEKNHHIVSDAIASIGDSITLNLMDPLLTEAIKMKKTVSLQDHSNDKKHYNGLLLLAVPLTDVFGNLLGIIAVNKMPFRSYTPEKIKLISILSVYIGDFFAQSISPAFMEIKNEEFRNFLLQVQRCIQNVATYNVPSSIVCFEFKNQQNFEMTKMQFLEKKRCLDQAWIEPNKYGNQVIFLLLPLTNSLAVNSFKTRLERLLDEDFSFQNFQAANISFHQHDLLPIDNVIDVMNLLTAQLETDKPPHMKVIEKKRYAISQ
ncbi:MAG: hypothetical protein KAH20_10575 [Methylococcales bacterium]|nr:hypothetical protein [Methylococcales bacterium]